MHADHRILSGVCLRGIFHFESVLSIVFTGAAFTVLSPPMKADFHRCSLSLSLSLRCGDVSVGNRGGGAARSNSAGCFSAPSIKNTEQFLLKSRGQQSKLLCSLVTVMAPYTEHSTNNSISSSISVKRIRVSCFPFYCQCHRPFHCALGLLTSLAIRRQL